MTDAPLDLADKAQVAARALTKKQRDNRAAEDLDFIMSTPAGRRFMARMMSLSPFNVLSYVEGGNTHDMTYREGRRSIVAELTVEVLRVCPASYGLMMTETNVEGK